MPYHTAQSHPTISLAWAERLSSPTCDLRTASFPAATMDRLQDTYTMADAAADDSSPYERSDRRLPRPVDDGPRQHVWLVPSE